MSFCSSAEFRNCCFSKAISSTTRRTSPSANAQGVAGSWNLLKSHGI